MFEYGAIINKSSGGQLPDFWYELTSFFRGLPFYWYIVALIVFVLLVRLLTK